MHFQYGHHILQVDISAIDKVKHTAGYIIHGEVVLPPCSVHDHSISYVVLILD